MRTGCGARAYGIVRAVAHVRTGCGMLRCRGARAYGLSRIAVTVSTIAKCAVVIFDFDLGLCSRIMTYDYDL